MTAPNSAEGALYRFALAFDENDLETVFDCFTDDVFHDTGLGVTLVGKDDVRAFFTDRRAKREARGEQVRHVVTNVLIEEETADSASIVSYLTAVVTTADTPLPTFLAGRIRDLVVAERDGWWRIKERHIHLDNPPDTV